MKKSLILLLGCLPLALATARSFLELRAMAGGAADAAPPGDAAPAQGPQTAESAAASGLAGADLLTAAPVPELAKVAADGALGGLAASWPRWTASRRQIDDYLAAERAAARGDAESLKDAVGRLQQLKETLEAAPQRPPLLALVEDRIAALRQETVRRQRETEAAALLAKAQAAFQANRFDQAASASDEWLAKYGTASGADAAQGVRRLQERAEFHRRRELASAQLRAARTPAEREAVLAGFVRQFPDRPSWEPAERGVLQKCNATLDQLRARRQADERLRAAEEAVRALRGSPPAGLEPRLAAAAEILAGHPAPEVKALLRGEAGPWLAEAIPEKRLVEDRLLQEAETAGHEILRGYFRKVQTPGGGLGYKRYDTLEQLQRPTSDVGTYLADQFLDKPGPSLPRKCLAQYTEGRQRLLAEPGRKQGWQELAALCEGLDRQLDLYRQKPGSSQEPLSFADEARLLKSAPAGPAWKHVETLWSP